MPGKKISITTLILSLLFNLVLSGPAFSSTANYNEVRKNAYTTLEQILLNKNNYLPFRLQILKNIAEIEGIDIDFPEIVENDIRTAENIEEKNNIHVNTSSEIKAEFLKDKNNAFSAYLLGELALGNEKIIKDFSIQILEKMNNKEALPAFSSLAQSSDIDAKLTGIKGLARINDKDSANILLNLLINASTEDKKAITEGLSNFQDNRIIEPITRLVQTEKSYEIIINSAIILINNGKQEYLNLLTNYLFSKNINESRYAALKLSDINKKLDYSLIEKLSLIPDIAVKIGVISALDKYLEYNQDKQNQESILKILRKYIFDKSDIVSISAIKVLAEYKNYNINKILKPLIYDKELSPSVINIVLSTNNKYLAPTLEEIAQLDNEELRLYAAKSLLNYNQNADKILENLSKTSQNETIKLSASILLSKLSKNTKYVEEIAKDKNDRTSEIATLYLANTEKNAKFLGDLREIISKESYSEDDIIAALLLLSHNDKSGSKIIRKYLSARKPASLPLDNIQQDILEELLADNDKWIKLNSAYNLARSGNNRGNEVIRGLLFDVEDFKIRASAALMLGETGTMQDIPALAALYQDKYVRVSANAATSIIKLLAKSELSYN